MMSPEAEGTGPQTKIQISRPVFDMKTFSQIYEKKSSEEEKLPERVRRCLRSCKCGPEFFIKCLDLVPIVGTLKEYPVKRNLVPDLVAGLTVGVMHLPMGLAFAILAHIPAVYGLYASFWPTLLYAVFGTGQHISMGTMAVMSLLLGTVVDRAKSFGMDHLGGNVTGNNDGYTGFNATESTEDVLTEAKVTAAIGATFLMGLIQILLSILNMGKIAAFMSVSFISGFTTGAVCHIVTSQIRALLGIGIPGHIGIGRLVLTLYEICRNLRATSVPSLVLSIVSMTSLILMKVINDNEKIKPYLKIPIPAELILVVVTTILSHFFRFNERFRISVVGEIPRGFPVPHLPDLSGAQDYVLDSLIMAVVCFVISFAMASLFARKYGYEIHTNQEMLAYGMCHSVGACFFSFAGAAAPPRCMVLDGTGGRTQVAALFSSVILLLIILVIGPLFQSLPHPVLASIVICALIPMFCQFKDPYDYWKVNHYDTATWCMTWAAVVFLDVIVGLGVGIAFSVFTVTLQGFRGRGYTLENAPATELYYPLTENTLMLQNPKNPPSKSQRGITIFRFESALHFASRQQFKEQLIKATLNPLQKPSVVMFGSKTPFVSEKNGTVPAQNNNCSQPNGTAVVSAESTDYKTPSLHTIILDCGCITYMDTSGMHTLKSTCLEYMQAGVTVVLANCSISISETLRRAGLHDQSPTYPTVHDAVLANIKIESETNTV